MVLTKVNTTCDFVGRPPKCSPRLIYDLTLILEGPVFPFSPLVTYHKQASERYKALYRYTRMCV